VGVVFILQSCLTDADRLMLLSIIMLTRNL